MHLFKKDEDHDDHYDRITQPHELSREEKDELMFALLEHLQLSVYRAQFDPTFTILVPN